jgi:hypothetical protein
MLIDDFIEHRLVDEDYVPWHRFTTVDLEEHSNGWGDILASLEERYGHEAPYTGQVPRRPLENQPTIAAAIDSITRAPSIDDTPLWRVRCKVFPPSILLLSNSLSYCFVAGVRGKHCVFFTSEGITRSWVIRSVHAGLTTRLGVP